MILRPKIEWERGLERERNVFRGGEKSNSIERDRREMRENCAEALYRNPQFSMD